jgi:hypothetical protein
MFQSRWLRLQMAGLFLLVLGVASQSVVAEDMVHAVSGIVKHVDKASKTVVIKAADGTEHTIKYSEKTAVEGSKDAGKDAEKGSAEAYLDAKKGAKVTVRYTEKGSEKTAVAVKDAVD